MRERTPSLRYAWVSAASTVWTERTSVSATSRFVRPAATSSATRRSAGVSSPDEGARPPIRPSSSCAFRCPQRRAERLEARQRLPRASRGPPGAAGRGAARCPEPAACARARTGARGASRRARARPAPPRARRAPRAAGRGSGRGAERVEQRLGLIRPTEHGQGLDRVGQAAHLARRADPGGHQRVGQRPQVPIGGLRVADGELEEAERPDRRLAAAGERLLRTAGERQRTLGGVARGLDVAAPRRHHRALGQRRRLRRPVAAFEAPARGPRRPAARRRPSRPRGTRSARGG